MKFSHFFFILSKLISVRKDKGVRRIRGLKEKRKNVELDRRQRCGVRPGGSGKKQKSRDRCPLHFQNKEVCLERTTGKEEVCGCYSQIRQY